jgi:hypothetical protein
MYWVTFQVTCRMFLTRIVHMDYIVWGLCFEANFNPLSWNAPRAVDAGFFHQMGSKADMPKKVPNIRRIINNDILKNVNIVFFPGREGNCPQLYTALSAPYFFYLSKGGFPVLARSSSLRVHAWALSSNHNAKQLILIGCKQSQRAARSFVRGLEIRLNTSRFYSS